MTIQLFADEAGLREAGRRLAGGDLVAFPTETVYGLGADATNPAAVARLYAAKGRPQFNPLIAHVPDLAAARRLAAFTPEAEALAARFWPGPITLVLPAKLDGQVCDLARAGLASVAIRIPSDLTAQTILRHAGLPIVAPSANRSGHISPTKADHVLADLDGKIDAMVMGGDATIGLESSIFACLEGQVTLLRPGAIARAEAEAAIGRPIANHQPEGGNAPAAPGRLASHYAPHAPLRLRASSIHPGEACLAFGSDLPPGADPNRTCNLSPKGDLVEAASHLYAQLRQLDSLDVSGIAVVPLPESGLGEAIADRLRRAAAPKTDLS
jgi:L-threonylcarbamoyladenylate synthase